MLLLLVVRLLIAVRQRAIALRVFSGAHAPGQGLVEYGLVLVLVMVVCVAIVGATGQTISSVWYNKLLPAFQ